MANPKILVSGATGKVGTEVVKQLLKKNYPVRAMVRKQDARSDELKRLGAEIAVADVFDAEQVFDAMRGTQRVFYLPVVHPFMIQSSAAFAVAAHELKIESIVALTQWLSSPSHPSLLTRHHWLTDHLMPMIPNVAHTIVNPGLFGEVVAQLIPGAAVMGSFPNFIGDSRSAPASNADMARVVVAALEDPSKHDGKTYRPTGPESLSIPDIANILTKITGRKIKVQNMSLKMFLKVAKATGIPIYEAFITENYFMDGMLRTFEVNTPSTDVFDLTGQQPESFESIARRYAALPEAQPTLSNKLRAMKDFVKIIASSPYNIGKYVKQMNFPVPARPQLAGDSEIWHREHHSNLAEFLKSKNG